MQRKLRHLLLATLEDPYNPRSWSGTPFAIREALERRLERVTVRGAMKPARNPVDAALRLVLGGNPPRYPLWMTNAGLRSFAADTQAALDEHKPDALLCISSQRIIYLQKPPIPMFMLSDSPWISWKEAYKAYEPAPLLAGRFARLEAEVARRCDGMVYGSEWARQEAIRLFEVPPEKVHARPMGARWVPDISQQELLQSIQARPSDRLDLLFIGKDYLRKGGPLAIEIARALRASGQRNVTLHIVGSEPPLQAGDEAFIKSHGYLSTEDPQQAAALRQLLLRSHFLVVPTQAECYGLVFAEAQAFGLPPVACAVQAIPSVVLDGVTGIICPQGSPPTQYAERITAVVGDRERYRRMAEAARQRYLDLLNWDRFAHDVVEDIEQTLQPSSASPGS